MKTNDTLNAIQTMVDNAVDNAGYNSTRNARIVSRNTNNTYNIKMDGVDYANVVCYGCGILQANEVVKVIIPNGQASQMFILAICPYPVGSIYQTTDTTFDPSLVWGGTWAKIEGRVLVGNGDSDIGAVGATGGAKGAWRHSHTALSNGSHTHSDRVGWFDSAGTNNTIQAGGTAATAGNKSGHLRVDDGYGVVADGAHTHDTDAKGSTNNAGTTTSAINIANMPPYEVVVIWKRTA